MLVLDEWSDCLYSPLSVERCSSPSASSDFSFSSGKSPPSSPLGAGEGLFVGF